MGSPSTTPCKFPRVASFDIMLQRANTSCSVKEDDSIRYVGEENIADLPTNEVFPEQFSITIGKWFKCWDRDLGRFASNVKDEYPDD